MDIVHKTAHTIASDRELEEQPISVCMAVYNGASFLKECIDSILSQSFNDFEVVMSILKYSSDVCTKKGIKLYSNFTTNGMLLSDEVILQLNSLRYEKLPTSQITLDGNGNYHNKTRVGLDKKPTYDTIINNIAYALQHGNGV